MNTAYISHPSCLRHEMGIDHPESPARLSSIADRLLARGVLDYLQTYTAPSATLAQIGRAHTSHYIDQIFNTAPASGYRRVDPDTLMNQHTLEAARHAAGALVLATDLVLHKEVRRAFCAVRPPGHHAESDAAMGFCFFNNIAIGVHHAFESHNIERILLVDFDVHHGNGSEEIFANDSRVLMVSTFQSQLYPFSGEKPLGSNMVNVPLIARSQGEAMRFAVEEKWWPAVRDFQPQLIYVSAGFDAHIEDDMGNLGWRDADYSWLTKQLVQMSEEYCEGRLISTLEGGYAIPALSRCVENHVRILADIH